MQRLTRLFAAFLVATLVIHMGDWPFIDELFDDLRAQGVFQPHQDGDSSKVAIGDDGRKIPTGVGFQYSLAFASIAPPVMAPPFSCPETGPAHYPISQAGATEFIVPGPFKPPAA